MEEKVLKLEGSSTQVSSFSVADSAVWYQVHNEKYWQTNGSVVEKKTVKELWNVKTKGRYSNSTKKYTKISLYYIMKSYLKLP